MNQRPERFAVVVLCTAALFFAASSDVYAAANDSRKLNKEANALFLEENYTEALTAYEKVLSEEDTDNFQAKYGKALCLVKMEHYYQALETLQDTDGENEEEMIRISDAKRQIRNALLLHPNEDVVSYYRNRMMSASSFAAMRILLSAYPDYPETEYYRAFFYMDVFTFDTLSQMDGEVLEEISRYFETILEMYPWQEEFRSFYESIMAGQIDRCFVNGEMETAEYVTDQVLKGSPDSAKFLACKGEVLNWRGEYEDAEEYLRQAAGRDRTLKSVYENLMKSCYYQKKYTDTIETADLLLEMDEKNVYAYAYLGLSYKKTGEKELSDQYIQKVRDAVPDYNKICALTLIGCKNAAVQLLSELSVEYPEYLSYARFDHDLRSLHFKTDFRILVGENYAEEFSDLYTAVLAIGGLILYFLMMCFEIRRNRKAKLMVLLLLAAASASLQPVEAYARDFGLHQAESEEIYGANDTADEIFGMQDISGRLGFRYESEICRDEVEWFAGKIRLGQRTVLPLDIQDTEDAGDLVKAATVNVQAILAGSIYGQGSGVIASYSDEEIIVIGCRHTAYTDRMRVRFSDETYAPAEIVGKSEDYDFMALKVRTEDVPEKTLSYIKKINVDYEAARQLSASDPVLSNGYITTRGYMCFEGEITNLRKSFSNFEPYYTNHVGYLLTDTKAAAGTSGGGTFDGYGNFIGLQAGIVVATGERYVVPLDIVAKEYLMITGEMLQ